MKHFLPLPYFESVCIIVLIKIVEKYFIDLMLWVCVCVFFLFHSLSFFYLFGLIFINSLYWKHLVEHRTNCWMHKKRFARISRKKPLVVVLSSRFFFAFCRFRFFQPVPSSAINNASNTFPALYHPIITK